MKQVIGLFFVLLVVMLATAWLSKPENLEKVASREKQEEKQQIEIAEVKVGDKIFQAEIARTREERNIGLTKYASLDEGKGMLFVFEEGNARPAFWMKDMNFPIDIIWINDGKVSQISLELPTVPEGTPEAEIPKYLPNGPIDFVLEISAGEAKEKRIRIGDEVEIRYRKISS